MVKIDIEYICDECGKSKKEKTIIKKGYDSIDDIMKYNNSGYLPNGWSCSYKKNKTILNCTKCTNKNIPKDAIWIA